MPGTVTAAPLAVERVRPRERTPFAATAPRPSTTGAGEGDVGEGRRLNRSGRPWPSRRRGQTGKLGGNDARLAAALDFAGQLSGFFAAG